MLQDQYPKRSGVVRSRATANSHLPPKWSTDLESESLTYFFLEGGEDRCLIHVQSVDIQLLFYYYDRLF